MNPNCYAMLFADKIIIENNGKKGIIGVFKNFKFPSLPITVAQWWIFIGLTRLEGKLDFTLNLIYTPDGTIVLPIKGEIDAKSPHDDIDLIIPINNFTFSKSGEYELSLYINGTYVGAKTLTVSLLSPPKQSIEAQNN